MFSLCQEKERLEVVLQREGSEAETSKLQKVRNINIATVIFCVQTVITLLESAVVCNLLVYSWLFTVVPVGPHTIAVYLAISVSVLNSR